MRAFGFMFLVAYWCSYLMLWARASRLRNTVPKATALPDTFSLFLGTAALGYLWSGRYREANDLTLRRVVLATRITQLLVPAGALLLLSS